jgi:opacity protein-like surface antigen
MKRTLMTLAAAAVIGTAGMAATTQSAQAAWWIAPAIIGGVLLGGATVATAANANGPYGYYDSGYAPAGNVYVRPAGSEFANCRIHRERVPGGYRRVQVCY